MVLAVVELYKRKDVIYDILVAYVKYVLKNESNKSNERKLARVGADIASTALTEKATKLATSYAIAKSISEALNTSMAVRTAIGSWSSGVLTILQYYGKNQKAAMASRRLRMLEPGYYHILYAMKVEMLYIFIEPILSKIIKNINSLKNPTYEDIITILEGGE